MYARRQDVDTDTLAGLVDLAPFLATFSPADGPDAEVGATWAVPINFGFQMLSRDFYNQLSCVMESGKSILIVAQTEDDLREARGTLWLILSQRMREYSEVLRQQGNTEVADAMAAHSAKIISQLLQLFRKAA